jgi:hypothetical protein
MTKRRTAPAEPVEQKPSPNIVRYRVAEGVLSISNENGYYPVRDGIIALPAKETWYLDMLGFTLLEKVE